MAAHGGHTEIVRLLLESGADIEVICNKDYRPLHTASKRGHVSTVELLLEKKAETQIRTKSSATPLQLAKAQGHHEIARMIITSLFPGAKNDIGYLLLHNAAKRGDVLFAKDLLDTLFDINAITKRGTTPLMLAVSYKKPDMVKMLLDRGADPNCTGNGWAPLDLAINGKHTELEKLLRDAGAKEKRLKKEMDK
jgi:ankyrin repeat protein